MPPNSAVVPIDLSAVRSFIRYGHGVYVQHLCDNAELARHTIVRCWQQDSFGAAHCLVLPLRQKGLVLIRPAWDVCM